MTSDDIFCRTKGAYLCLVHPVLRDPIHLEEISSVVALARSVPDEVIAAMIVGPTWRERLLGICMATANPSASVIDPMLQSLRDPLGISIVPACAALAVLARHDLFSMPRNFCGMFDRHVFDGEIGWATDKAMHFVGLLDDNAAENGPNYGQCFDDHVQVYGWICGDSRAR